LELADGRSEIFGIQDSQGTSPEKFRAIRPSLDAQLVEPSDEIVVQLD
jgi:hypothetical protein